MTSSDSDFDSKSIKGNASDEIKYFVGVTIKKIILGVDSPKNYGFARSVGEKIDVEEVSYVSKVEAQTESRKEGRVVTSLIVDEDMVNSMGTLHGGAIAFLVDVCTTMAISCHEMSAGGDGGASVSLALNVIYHSPAAIGERLRLVSTTMSMGARAMTSRCEIWNDTRHRQVATGTHTKMSPSEKPDERSQKLKATL